MPRGDNAGRPMGKRHQDDVRKKIQASQLINRLMKAFEGEITLTSEQVNVGKCLLNKVLPDLKAIEHSGEIEHKHSLANVLSSID